MRSRTFVRLAAGDDGLCAEIGGVRAECRGDSDERKFVMRLAQRFLATYVGFSFTVTGRVSYL